MKKIILLLSVTFLVGACGMTQSKTNENTNTTMENSKDSVSYSLGILISKNLKNQGLDSINYEQFIAGMKTVMSGEKATITDQQANEIITAYMQELSKRQHQATIDAGNKYLAENGKRKGVTTTASGLQYEVLKQGTGAKPKDLNTNVTAHYHGTLIDGTVFDSSVQRNQPFNTNVGQVIKAWQEALLLMNVGTKLRIVCPYQLAYGEKGAGGAIKPYSVLIFEMELISINN